VSLEHLILEFVSHFEIRISDFANVRRANHALWLKLQFGPLGQDSVLVVFGLKKHYPESGVFD
jgi:hypothetical protein